MTDGERGFLAFIIPFYKEILLHDYPVVGETMRYKKMSAAEKGFIETVKTYHLKVYELNTCNLKKFNSIKFFICYEDNKINIEKMNPSGEFLVWCKKVAK